MTDAREKRVELILQQLEELPTLPVVAIKVLEATQDDATSAKDVVNLIQSDPALSARVLQLVHRADLGVRGEVSSVERAVSLLGFEAVRCAVLAISVFNTFGDKEKDTNALFSRGEFWKHCVAVACCAELLAVQLQKIHGKSAGVEPAEAFVCGLLHDLGKVALDAMLPKSFSRVVEAADLLRGNIADVERQVIGLDHMIVGKRLAERWQLPTNIRQCIWLHGQMPQALPATVRNTRLVNLITLADTLVREQHVGYSGNYVFSVPRQTLADAVGLPPEAVEAALTKLVDAIEPRAKALGLGQASSSELYHHALAQANRELGRVSGQLASKNRKLATRAKFFDALSGFQSELRPDAPTRSVIGAIAQTAAGVLGVEAAAVVSLPPGRDYAEVMVFDGTDAGEISIVETSNVAMSDVAPNAPEARPMGVAGAGLDALWSACGTSSAGSSDASDIVPSHRLLPIPTPGNGPVMPVCAEMEWVVNPVSPKLAHEGRFWIALQTDGECVGGVIWGARAGESQRLSPQAQELTALAAGWSLALRTAQIREEARALSEQLADANRRLQDAQTELLRTKTVLTISEMAAGAAHEMNNPLAVISGRSQMLAAALTDPRQKASANLIFEQSHRLSEIITELMHFAQPIPARPVDMGLSGIVLNALHCAKEHTNPVDRKIEWSIGDIPPVTVDPEQLSSALVELIANAIAATDERNGRIDIAAAFDPYSRRVVLTIADDGHGMDDGTLKRAFDPFYSSKPAGRRRGMGLAKALRWVEGSGGSIRLESRPGHGTRAVVFLPAAATEAQPLPLERKRPA